MRVDCRVCRYWNFFSAIASEEFKQFHRYYNISDLYLKEPECDKYCNRPCCFPEIKSLLSSNHTSSFYQDLINQALNLSSFSPLIYLKAIIAEIKLDKNDLIMQFLEDPTLDHLLNRQKYDFYRSRKNHLDPDELEIFGQLRDQIIQDQATLAYKRLFGNELQRIILGLLPQQNLLQLLRQPHPLSLTLQILSYLEGSNLEPYLLHQRSEFRQIALAKSNLATRIRTIESNSSIEDKIAAIHDLSALEMVSLLENVNFHELDQAVQLKIVGVYHDTDFLFSLLDHSSGYLQASVIYHLLKYHQIDFALVEKKIRDLIVSQEILIQLPNVDEFYYQIVLNNPDHKLAPYLINLIRNRKMLQKLMFHSKLRVHIRLRLSFLH